MWTAKEPRTSNAKEVVEKMIFKIILQVLVFIFWLIEPIPLYTFEQSTYIKKHVDFYFLFSDKMVGKC